MEPPRFTFELNVEELIAKFRDRPDDLIRELPGALYVEAEKIMTAAKRITPVDENILRASGHVRLPEIEGDRVEVEMGFGGPAGTGNNRKDVGYAVYVHEDLTARHTVGQAKFLEVPFNQAKAGMMARLAARIKRRIR